VEAAIALSVLLLIVSLAVLLVVRFTPSRLAALAFGAGRATR
jgi:ABC-type sulfate transport system permease component